MTFELGELWEIQAKTISVIYHVADKISKIPIARGDKQGHWA